MAPTSRTCWLPGQKVALYGKVEFDTYSGTSGDDASGVRNPLADDDDGDASLHTGRIVPVYEAAGKDHDARCSDA